MLHELARGSEFVRTITRAGRTHDHRPSVGLPAPAPLAGRLDDVLARRRSSAAEVLRPVALDELAAILVGSYGASPRLGKPPRRPVPSGGALYPLELYVAAATVRGLAPGLYHFQPFRRCLSLLAPLDWSRFRAALVDPSPLDTSAALLVVTAVFWRSRIKYGLRGYRFGLLEAGHLVQTIQLAATDLGLSALPVGGFFDRRLDAAPRCRRPRRGCGIRRCTRRFARDPADCMGAARPDDLHLGRSVAGALTAAPRPARAGSGGCRGRPRRRSARFGGGAAP